MTTSNPLHTPVTGHASSSEFASPPNARDIPEETSPLLQPKRAQRLTVFKRWKFARSSFLDDNFGLIIVAVAEFFVFAMNATVKLLNSSDEPLPILEIILFRGTILSSFSLAYMYWKSIPDPMFGPKGLRTLLFLRGLAGFLGIYGLYFSVQYLSLSDVTVLTFIAPILTGLSGAVFLGEPLSVRVALAGLCSFLGVISISRPEFLFGGLKDPSEVTPAQRMLSVILALIGVLGLTGNFLFLRAIGGRPHILHPVISFSLLCVLFSTLGMILFEVPLVIPTRTMGLVLLFLNTIFSVLGQVLLAIGLQYETAGRGSLALYPTIIFALVFEFTVLHTMPSALSNIGTLMILTSAIYTTLTKETDIKPAADSFIKRPSHGASPSDHEGHLNA